MEGTVAEPCCSGRGNRGGGGRHDGDGRNEGHGELRSAEGGQDVVSRWQKVMRMGEREV